MNEQVYNSPPAIRFYKLIEEAKNKKLWLVARYDGGIWFSPDELERKQEEGNFIKLERKRMKYQVWSIPVEGTTLFEKKLLHETFDREDADEYAYLYWMDDPVPDKSDYYYYVKVIEVEKS